MKDTELPRAVLNREQAKEYLGISISTLNELTQTGRLRSLRVNRRRLYRLSDLDQFLADQVDYNAN